MVIGGFKPKQRMYTCAARQRTIYASAFIMCERASERCESPRHLFNIMRFRAKTIHETKLICRHPLHHKYLTKILRNRALIGQL